MAQRHRIPEDARLLGTYANRVRKIIRRRHPDAELTVWAEDEHRIGLLPVVRRMWARRGQRPTAWANHRYQWLSVYA